jgi:hypothetical protein
MGLQKDPYLGFYTSQEIYERVMDLKARRPRHHGSTKSAILNDILVFFLAQPDEIISQVLNLRRKGNGKS